jgi:glycosyltransferase involved in cell wall biosynthesis
MLEANNFMAINPQQMKNIFFTESSVNIGGQELQALQQMADLGAKGYKTILLCKPSSKIGNLARERKLTVFDIAFKNPFDIVSIFRVIGLIKRFRPQAIFSHGSRDAYISFAARLMLSLSRSFRKVLLYRVKTFQHGSPIAFSYNYFFSKTLTPSEYLKNRLLENPAIHPNKIEVLYPGIHFESLGQEDQKLPSHVLQWLDSHPGPVISHGAILRGEKGHKTLLQALVRVKKVFPNVRYLIAGEGQDKPLLEAEIAKLDLTENVLLTGILSHIAPLLHSSDVAVLPSLIEPLGMFQIESQYLEVPTIVSDVGGVPETILDKKTGLMIEAGNVDSWADAIIWTLSHLDEAKKMAQEGKRFVINKFSLSANTAKLIELIESEH